MTTNPALARLRHHVTGAIERGEAEAIIERPAGLLRVIGGVPCASCGDEGRGYASAVHGVRARPECAPIAEVFPSGLAVPGQPDVRAVRLCDPCAEIASVPLGSSYATAEPEFEVVPLR